MNLTYSELQLIEKALELQITIYESYGRYSKIEKALDDCRSLLIKIQERINTPY